MNKEFIDDACQRFLQSDSTPEEFHNQLIDEGWLPSVDDSKILIRLFYGLRRVDERILTYTNNTEGLR